ncbi:MAG TPA: peptidylprolyl isomerase, partial [Rhodocyclaceae bacterium]|nr:peptidylprolyl isomerase [Rhodocyclaceae bacterium]
MAIWRTAKLYAAARMRSVRLLKSNIAQTDTPGWRLPRRAATQATAAAIPLPVPEVSMSRLSAAILGLLLASAPGCCLAAESGGQAQKAALTDQLAAFEMFRLEAARRGLYAEAEVAAAPPAQRDALAVRRLLLDAVRPAPVPESAVRALYDATVTTLGPNEYRASLIGFADPARAEQFLDRLKSGGGFSAPAGSGGRASGWFGFPLPPAAGRSGGLPPPVAEALLRLRPGMVAAEPVAHEGTWYVIRLDAVRPTAVPDYTQARTH